MHCWLTRAKRAKGAKLLFQRLSQQKPERRHVNDLTIDLMKSLNFETNLNLHALGTFGAVTSTRRFRSLKFTSVFLK
jgi:hypothetical protein